VEKGETVKPMPSLLQFVGTDAPTASGANAEPTIAPWTIGTINGYRLKFDAAQSDEGIYLISSSGNVTKAGGIQRNKPGQLVFQIEDLPAGPLVYIEVRSRFTTEGELRVGRLPYALTPVPAAKPQTAAEKTEADKIVTV
jgi:hypothetical protein